MVGAACATPAVAQGPPADSVFHKAPKADYLLCPRVREAHPRSNQAGCEPVPIGPRGSSRHRHLLLAGMRRSILTCGKSTRKSALHLPVSPGPGETLNSSCRARRGNTCGAAVPLRRPAIEVKQAWPTSSFHIPAATRLASRRCGRDQGQGLVSVVGPSDCCRPGVRRSNRGGTAGSQCRAGGLDPDIGHFALGARGSARRR